MRPCVGIDVAKHTLEWSLGSEGRIEHVRNEPRPIAALVRRLVELDPDRIVVESTRGYERMLVEKLAAAGLPVVVVNPRRVRSFAEGVGVLAKTDALDARLLALFGEKAEPPIRPIAVAERNRCETATAPIRRTIEPVLRTLQRHDP